MSKVEETIMEKTLEKTTAEKTTVEKTLLAQKDHWRSICARVGTFENRDFPYEGPKRVIFFGIGSSYLAAKLCQLALKRDTTRKRTPVIVCPSTHVGVDAVPSKGDWVFAFTHRGRAGPTLDAMRLSAKLGAFTVQVSALGVEKDASANVLLETVPQEQIEPHTAAVTGAICAVTALLLGAKGLEEWDALTSIPVPDLETLRKRAGTGPNIILGEWEGEFLAKEAALKLMEMARVPVRAFGSEEFHHGPIFSKKKTDVIWHVSLPKDPRASQIEPALTVSVYGSSPLAWVPALVELQWLALATALNLGVDPDTQS